VVIHFTFRADVVAGADQAIQVGADIGRDDRVRIGRLDLGDVGREVLHAAGRVQLGADDLYVRPQLLQEAARGRFGALAHLIVHIDQVDLLDGGILAQITDQGLVLHADMSIGAELPERAVLIGHILVLAGPVDQQDFLAGIAGVELLDRVQQRQGHIGTDALDDEMDVLRDSAIQAILAVLGIELAVAGHQFGLGAGHAARVVVAFHRPLEILQRAFQGRRLGAGQRIDQHHLEGRRDRGRDRRLRLRGQRPGQRGRQDGQG